MKTRPSLALVVDHVPHILAANFQAVAERLVLTLIELDPKPSTIADPEFYNFNVRSSRSGRHSRVARVEGHLDDASPDAVLTLGWYGLKNMIALRWAAKTKTPAILCTDSNQFDFVRRSLGETVKRSLVRHYGVGWAAGQYSRNYLHTLEMDPQRIVVGPVDTIDNAHFHAGAEAARAQADTLRQRYRLPESYFLAANRLSPEKNVLGLLQAYDIYRRRTPNSPWRLVIVGEGSQRRQIEQRILELGLSELVVLAGLASFDVLPVYYGLANAFILASTKEPWGVVVNEAAAAGLPLLVSNRAGSAPHLIRESINGFSFDPANATEMAVRMCDIPNGKVARDAMGQASRRIVDGWTPERYADSLFKAVQRAMSMPLPNPSTIDRLLTNAWFWKMAFQERTAKLIPHPGSTQ